MKKSILLALLLAMVLVSSVIAADDTIRIGVYAPLSGDAAMVGKTLVEGVQLATKEINAAGGIAGKQIELFIEDDEQSPKVAVNAVNKLIFDHKVIGIIGTVNSSCVLQSMEVSWDNEVPHITPIGSNTTITQKGNPWIARLQASDRLQAAAITRYAVETLGAKRIAVIYQSDDYGTGGAETVKKVLAEEFKMEPVAFEPFEPAALDVSPQVLNIKNANADAIVIYSMYQQGALVAKKVREMGMTTPLMGAGGLTNKKLFELGGDAVVGLANTQTFFADLSKASPAAAEFIKAFQAEYDGRMPDSNNAMSYDSMRVMIEGLKYAAPDFKNTKIMEGIKAVKDMPLATGDITIDENGDANRDILIIGIKAGGGYELLK